MKKSIVKLAITLMLFVAFFILQKILFIAVYHSFMQNANFSDFLAVIWHGLPMDFSVAGYLSVIPAIIIIAGIWTTRQWLQAAFKIYIAIVAALIGTITTLDLALYGYWGFRLDMTPIFYFTTSPSAAMASATWWQLVAATAAIAVIAYGIYLTFTRTVCRINNRTTSGRVTATAVMTVLTASLFIPIRGGLTVSTMNLSRSYFSNDKRLNHAAVNPAFSLLYSATHQDSFGEEYKTMPREEAMQEMEWLAEQTTVECANDTLPPTLLRCKRPDIYLIILESFSAHLMPSLGGESIAVKLDSIAHSGISFTNFYANSFRTDRALPSILSGFPAQPSMSLLKYVEKIEELPSIASELKKAGYFTSYYYGGDINFANINAYLVSSGFDRIICDNDFPLAQRTSKWGAHDDILFQRTLSDALAADNDIRPRFTVIQTSSSHEPFDVPYLSKTFAGHPQKNAFSYTDSCLCVFTDRLKESQRYDSTLVVIVPDHLGAWPLDLPDATERHHVPLVFTGGALNKTKCSNSAALDACCCNSMPGSQIDIAATLLGMLGIDATPFPFSKNLFDCSAPHYAVFTEPSLIGIVTSRDTIVYNCDARVVEKAAGDNAMRFEPAAKAYLQEIYEAISDL